MAHLIDKDVLVAEIERRIQCYSKNGCEPNSGKWVELISIKHFINTLEVKEVNLEEEIELIKGDYAQVDVAWNNDFDFIAKHFFELGLKAKQC
jgi:hypothetical protein